MIWKYDIQEHSNSQPKHSFSRKISISSSNKYLSCYCVNSIVVYFIKTCLNAKLCSQYQINWFIETVNNVFSFRIFFSFLNFRISIEVLPYIAIILLKLLLSIYCLFFGAAHGWGGGAKKPPLPKICHRYPTMMKLGTVIPYLKKIKKYLNHVIQPLSSADISIFSLEISKFYYINKYRYRLHFDTEFEIP